MAIFNSYVSLPEGNLEPHPFENNRVASWLKLNSLRKFLQKHPKHSPFSPDRNIPADLSASRNDDFYVFKGRIDSWFLLLALSLARVSGQRRSELATDVLLRAVSSHDVTTLPHSTPTPTPYLISRAGVCAGAREVVMRHQIYTLASTWMSLSRPTTTTKFCGTVKDPFA